MTIATLNSKFGPVEPTIDERSRVSLEGKTLTNATAIRVLNPKIRSAFNARPKLRGEQILNQLYRPGGKIHGRNLLAVELPSARTMSTFHPELYEALADSQALKAAVSLRFQ